MFAVSRGGFHARISAHNFYCRVGSLGSLSSARVGYDAVGAPRREMEQPLKIAAAVHSGVLNDARVLKEGRSLAAAGHDVYLFGISSESRQEMLDENLKVILSRVDPDGQRARLRAVPNPTREQGILNSFQWHGATLARAILKTLTPDVIHLHDHLSLTAAGFLRRCFAAPLVWDAHEIYEHISGDEERSRVNAAIIAKNQRYIDRFITINHSIAHYYAEHYPLLPAAAILPNSRVWEPPIEYDGRLHQASDLPLDQRILLFQGVLGRGRGIPALLEAAARLPDGWTVVFMGWGPLAPMIDEYPRSQDTNGRPRVVRIDGAPNSELMRWSAGASLGAIPYENVSLNHTYCTPNKLWELPMAGVPLLATGFPELARMIDAYRVGLLLPLDFTSDDIVEAVRRTSASDLDQMRERCKEYAKVNNWSKDQERLIDLYADLEERTRLHRVLTTPSLPDQSCPLE